MKTSLKLKNNLIILFLSFATTLNVAIARDLKINLSFSGPNANDRAEITLSHKGDNLGALSIKALDLLKIPYLGNERGIHTIFNTPVGDEAIEIISNQEMKAYGWCFTVNDVLEEVYPDEIDIYEDKVNVHWFYGYAHYLAGEWIGQCIPAI
jgi:hypothetical protein